jgi:ubiquinone/menaquinone biosynthesis C-methylase UbiE|tara:strand:- start:115 stop:822 length:708 start_codon:yes stop_codon:yes gene_type:complete
MKSLRNWDNKTWLSSKKYITAFNIFLKSKIKFNKNTTILDIGCGRANIISSLQNKYRFKNKPVGIDIVKNRNIKHNILFKRSDAIQYLREKESFDLILIKQTIHFFTKKRLNFLLNLAKKKLNPKGKILIFSLKRKNNEIPCFKLMKKKLNESLKKDQLLFKMLKKNLKKINESNFNFKVNITKKKYISMINSRYISCLLDLSKKDLNKGIIEIKSKFKKKIKFTDTLKCICYNK